MNKKISISIVIVLIFVIAFSFFCTTVSAADTPCGDCGMVHTDKICPLCRHMHDTDELGGMESLAYGMVCYAYGDVFTYSSANDDENADPFSLGSIIEFDINGKFAPLFNVAESMYDNLTFLGFLIIFIYFLLEIAEVSMGDGFTYETMAMHGIKTLLA